MRLGTTIDLIRLLRNKRNILTKISIELVGPEEECRELIKKHAALRGEEPHYSGAEYAYGLYEAHQRESTVVFHSRGDVK